MSNPTLAQIEEALARLTVADPEAVHLHELRKALMHGTELLAQLRAQSLHVANQVGELVAERERRQRQEARRRRHRRLLRRWSSWFGRYACVLLVWSLLLLACHTRQIAEWIGGLR